MAIILGIDPGSCITGYGLIRSEDNSITYLESGAIKVKDQAHPKRLADIYADLSSIIDQYQPTDAAIESIFVSHNAQSALKLGQARGAAMLAVVNKDIELSEYTARQVKQAVVGYGAAKKDQVAHMVQSLLGLSGKIQSDAADALAIALCHVHSAQSLSQVAGATKVVRGRWV